MSDNTSKTGSPDRERISTSEDYGNSLKKLTNTIADWGFIHKKRIITRMKKD